MVDSGAGAQRSVTYGLQAQFGFTKAHDPAMIREV